MTSRKIAESRLLFFLQAKPFAEFFFQVTQVFPSGKIRYAQPP
jgi:hypothetical protein